MRGRKKGWKKKRKFSKSERDISATKTRAEKEEEIALSSAARFTPRSDEEEDVLCPKNE